MNILLVRHAEKENDEKESVLTKKGVKQAKYLAKRLGKIKIDEFYCSDLERVKETSRIVSRKINLKPKIKESLNEFNRETLKKEIRNFNKNEKKQFKDLNKFLMNLMKHPRSKKTILIIAHGFTNRFIFSQFLNLNHTKLLPCMQHETGIDEFSYNAHYNNWRLDGWNDFNHLPRRLR